MNSASPFLSRLLALFLACGLVYGAIITYRLVPDLMRKYAITDLDLHLKGGNQENALSTLDLMNQMTRPLEVLPFPPLSIFSPLDWNTFLIRLRRKITLLHYLERDEYDSPEIQPTLALLSPSQRESISESIEDLKKSDRLIRNQNKKLESLESRERQLEQQIFLLLSDLRSLINLEPETVKDESPELSSYQFYDEGLFQDLPMLKELPNPPQDITSLRDQLESLEVPLPKINPQEFEDRLTSLGISGARIRANIQSIESQTSTANDSLSAEQQIRDEAYNQMRQELLKIIKTDVSNWNS